MPQGRKPRKVMELSRKNRRLLEDICKKFGTHKEAREDPNFVLEILLEGINKEKGSVSAMLTYILDDLSPSVLEYLREEQEEKEEARRQQRQRKKPLARKKAA